jgi:hypothetical protein
LKMEKYFAISDVHGCASYAKKAVKKAGFDPKNPNHFLVVLGDVFDRGTENEAVFEWLSSLKNVILVRGNHEQLMKEMIERGYPIGRDVHNGTCDTVLEIMGHTRKELSDALDKVAPMPDFDGGCAALKKNMEKRDEAYFSILKEWFSAFADSPAYRWQQGPQWRNFFRLGDFAFVHCWVPLASSYGFKIDYMDAEKLAKRSDWDKASDSDWADAAWGCPFALNDAGLRPRGITLVVGHWTTSDFNRHYLHEIDDFSGYAGNGLIALDGSAAFTEHVNVAVFEKNDDGSAKFVGFSDKAPKIKPKK